MKTIKILTVAISFLFILTSCEKEIDLDLDESRQLYVIECIVHDSLGDNFVILSKTRPYKNNNDIEKISNANVQITDNLGNTFNLLESSAGYYTSSALKGISNRTYSLVVNVEGNTITANSTMPPRITIDSLSVEETTEAFWEDADIPEYRARCHFTDPGSFENFYRLKAFLGTEQEDGFLALDDEFFDGSSTYFPIFGSTFFKEDSITIQLLAIDELNYRYFTAIDASQGGQVPGNPITNLNGDNVVGYFGAYAKSERSIVVP
jgi:hypothetical protein